MNYPEFFKNLCSVGATPTEALRIEYIAEQRAFEPFLKTGSVEYTLETREKLTSEQRVVIWKAMQGVLSLGTPWEQVRDLII